MSVWRQPGSEKKAAAQLNQSALNLDLTPDHITGVEAQAASLPSSGATQPLPCASHPSPAQRWVREYNGNSLLERRSSMG